ncbi:carboxypeptidase-like regulatory domain-containing protein [Singulisphaera sp. Ch08]|uniref:Carboxypeptidase-like regulatory domain-containing protein n=1 Tax=Singulisphaera sp. Ch08 TaxID=3120278 RepID=A0AAU7C9P4_9BACT
MYEWDFGDGQQATTRVPVATHDYFAAIDHAAGLGQFVVTCRARHSDVTVRRSLTIHSAYAICKAAGTIVPHVTADLFAHKEYSLITASFAVHNVEDAPMVLDRLSITPTADDGEAVGLPGAFVAMERPVTIPPRSTAMIGVNIPFTAGVPGAGELSHEARGFAALYAGTAAGMPVRCGAAFDLPVEEWGQRPRPIPIPDVPPRERQPWPWELVEQALRDSVVNPVVNPAGGAVRPGDAVLDAATGTLAVSLGGLSGASRAGCGRRGACWRRPSRRPRSRCRRARGGRRRGGRAWVMAAPAPLGLDVGGVGGIGAAVRIARQPRLAARDRVRISLAGIGGMLLFEGPPVPGFIAVGQICDPDNLSEADLAAAEAGQLVCQLTTETKEVLMPARWMNARKGDCILSPGGDGIIGGLMLNVKPAQWYSHCGIMTRNHDEITHSTGSQKRVMDHLIGFTADGSDGFEPNVLKYVWPGAITQTVQRSIEGEDFPDPEYDKTYSISSFGAQAVGFTHNDHFTMIPPLVLKPDPLQETPGVRTALHAIADSARAGAGRPGVKPKYHYRWYCYTDPTIGLGPPAGPETGWAVDTLPSVCSSYVWMHAKALGAHLETSQTLVTPTDLEPKDVETGAVVRPTTPDGLYNYSAQERHDAANWLFETVHNQAFEKAGWFGEALTDGADDIANQFLNAFANDDGDGKDSEEWKDLRDADAVSPDNMMWWDAPAQGGLYGYVEPAIYREPRVESYTVSKWKKVVTRGRIRGTVRGEAGPVSGAIVQVYDGKTTFTAADGTYALADVPLGAYQIKASRVIDGVLYSAQVNIELAGEELVVDIVLQPPSERYRVAQVFIDFFGRDYESFDDDELNDPGPEYFELELGPDKTVHSTGKTYKWGGEVRVEYSITVRLLVNNAIDVQVQGTLYEGTSEDTDDLDGTGGTTFQVGVGQTAGATLTITNTDEDDDDAGVLSISVKNVRNDN